MSVQYELETAYNNKWEAFKAWNRCQGESKVLDANLEKADKELKIALAKWDKENR